MPMYTWLDIYATQNACVSESVIPCCPEHELSIVSTHCSNFIISFGLTEITP